MVTMALIRSASDGTRPVVGSGVTSPTLNTPSCMSAPAPVPWHLKHNCCTVGGLGALPGHNSATVVWITAMLHCGRMRRHRCVVPGARQTPHGCARAGSFATGLLRTPHHQARE